MFPKLLEEVTVLWKDDLYSSKIPIQRASSLDFEGMDKLAMAHMVAAHVHPRLAATLPTQTTHLLLRFKSVMTERAYKAAALTVRTFNVTSMLSAYQSELFDDTVDVPDPSVWDEITTIADICCAVQATGKCMSMLVLQKRTRWLNLTDLSDKKKEVILDIPVDLRAYSAPLLHPCKMWCEAKKKEDKLYSSVSCREHKQWFSCPPGRLSPRWPPEVDPSPAILSHWNT